MRKKLLLALLLGTFTSIVAQDIEQLKDEYIRTYNPQSYAAYKSGEAVKKQGLALANNLFDNLQDFQGLVNTMNPDELLNDYNQQTQQIETLEAEFKQENNSYSFNTGRSIGNSFNNKDFEGGIHQLGGFLNNMQERKAAEKALQEKKEALRKERLAKMSKIYWKAQDYNEQTKQEYIKAAAFSESKIDEEYNLAFADNLDCFSKSMKATFSSTNSYWLQNKCPKPIKNNLAGIENKFVAKDVQYSNIAKHKFEKYTTTQHPSFREAAIAYAAAAAKTKPCAKYFYQLGSYYDGQSTILALSNYMTAQAYDKSFFNAEQNKRFEALKEEAEQEISLAINNNDQNFLQAFLSSGVDRIVTVNNKSILNYAIKLDQPDAVQLILNKYVENKPQTEVQSKLQKTIMVCTVNNSTKCLQRFIDLGVSTDFVMKKYTPIDVAEKVGAEDALILLLENTTEKEKYKSKLENTLYFQQQSFLKFCESKDYSGAANFYNNIVNTAVKEQLRDELIPIFYLHPEHIAVLEYMTNYTASIKTNPSLQEQFNQLFLFHFFFNLNKAYLKLIALDVVTFSKLSFKYDDIQKIHKIGYNHIYKSLKINIDEAGTLQPIANSNEDLQALMANLSKVMESGQMSNYGYRDFYKEAKLDQYTYLFTWQDIFLINQTYTYFWNSSKQYANSYQKGYALWDEKTESAEDLYNNVTSFINSSPWMVDKQQLSSVYTFKTKLNKASIYSNVKLGLTCSKGYKYYKTDEGQRNLSNSDIDFPTYMHEMLSAKSNNLLKYVILKRDNDLIRLINKKQTIDWNKEIDGVAAFLLLARTLNWEILNEIYPNAQLDITRVDNNGNSIFHYLADYYWQVFHKGKFSVKKPNILMPNMYNANYDKSVLLKKNNKGLTPWKVLTKNRKCYYQGIYIGLAWVKSFEKDMEPYLK